MKFDPFRERVFDGWIRILLLVPAALIIVSAPSMEFERVSGLSGDSYPIYEQSEVWRSVGPVLSVRFRTERPTRTAVAAEAADLLPYFGGRADSSDVRYLLFRATKPVLRLGKQFGLYRSWNFRYERVASGWVSSGYW